ncbi:hypothetical protein [Enterococcus hirae]|uniref:hypothetical protein n=1 Tax=Enterococcus hirae TaxID=1354 RepID=UPI00136E46B7|nr:hypothetical protein [Enterococcus hirae]NAE18345.1 hypothetical protein [Enterococcus hirae]
MSGWTTLLQLREGVLKPMAMTVKRDNFGDIVLVMDEGDGEKVCVWALSAKDRAALIEVLATGEPW